MVSETIPFQRVLLKLSGELFGDVTTSSQSQALLNVVEQIQTLQSAGVEIAIVVGGGNIYRGRAGVITRETGDYMGMYATVINGLVLSDLLSSRNIPNVLQSALPNYPAIEPVVPARAREALSAKKVVIFCGGTGHPFFSTDTASALRAVEIHADVILKATKVDGVYDADPVKNPQAKRLTNLTFDDVIQRNLQVMDPEAFCICREHNIQILVFSMNQNSSIVRAVQGESIGSLISA